MSGDFIDSNIFLYVFDPIDPVKQHTARNLVGRAIESGTASISFQVIQEILT